MKRKRSAPAASARLLRRLPFITAALAAEAPGAAFDSLQRAGTVDTELRRELAAVLHAISRGEPAGKLFRQNERRKPKVNRQGVALVYWYVRACTGNADRAAEQAARAQSFGQHTGKEKPLTKIYVRKIAQKHRDAVLRLLEQKPAEAAMRANIHLCNSRQAYVLLHHNGDVTKGKLSTEEAAELKELGQYGLTPEKVAHLRAHLQKKSEHFRG